MNNIIYLIRLSRKLIMVAISMLLYINAFAQEVQSLSSLEEQVKERLNCSFITTNDVPEMEAYQVLDVILQDSKSFSFHHPYLRKIVICNSNRGSFITNNGFFTEIRLPNTHDLKFLDYCIRHEIGHVIDHSNDARASNEWKTVRKHIDTKSISTYAGKNDEELFAELVAYRTSKEYGKTLPILPDDIEKMINKYLYN